jgi:hypothetical protein
MNVRSTIADDIAYVDRSSNSLCVSGSDAFETAFAFNMSWIVETAITFLTRSYYRKENAADMYMQDVLQPKSVFFTVCFDLHQLPRTIVSHISSYKSAL